MPHQDTIIALNDDIRKLQLKQVSFRKHFLELEELTTNVIKEALFSKTKAQDGASSAYKDENFMRDEVKVIDAVETHSNML